MGNVSVIGGDITTLQVDALITAINSSGMWFGGIDAAISRVAGGMFHAQAQAQMPLHDGQVIYAGLAGPSPARFNSVIFVVDDLQRPLREIVLAGLQEAERQQQTVVSLPALRTGVMAEAYEPTVLAALDETVEAINQFRRSGPRSVQQIYVVVYNDPGNSSYLKRKLSLES